MGISGTGYVREFLYRPDGRPNGPVVDCAAWDTADTTPQLKVLEESLAKLRESGYVVLEHLLSKEKVQMADDEFRKSKGSLPNGTTCGGMRAGRDMTVPPFAGIWKE